MKPTTQLTLFLCACIGLGMAIILCAIHYICDTLTTTKGLLSMLLGLACYVPAIWLVSAAAQGLDSIPTRQRQEILERIQAEALARRRRRF